MEHPKQNELFDHIDHAINDPPLTIEQALDLAVEAGRMTIKDAEECKEAYWRTFHHNDLHSVYKAAYEVHDDGATSPSTYDSLFYPDDYPPAA